MDEPLFELGVREVAEEDRSWVAGLIEQRWGAAIVVAGRETHRPAELPGYLALSGRRRVGLVTYRIDGEVCEIVTMNSLRPDAGYGSALLEAVKGKARESGCRRIRLFTTNDNIRALGFYQMRGFRMLRIDPGAVDRAREIKPEIPEVAESGIRIRDEILMECALG